MDERYLLTATRCMELNAVRAEQYPWGSAKAHLTCRDNVLVTVGALIDMVRDWGRSLSEDLPEEEIYLFRTH